jgi:MoxR-like ATPase
VLLEGPTAAGKTSTVLFLAALLGQPVVRLNLGGQTDTGELLGRYAPTPSGWTWTDGIVPRAMREGWWVVLDEINLAEPSVVERLNPVLERTPSLVLTEGDGTRFGPGGVPVAAGFHVFATMNPSDSTYGGRSALSPALRDRFGGQMMCDHATERDLLDQLRCMVHGHQPSVTCRGVTWSEHRLGDATHAALAQPGIDEVLATLARFHANVDAATRAEDDTQRLGAARREGMVVSRRTLLSLLDFVVLRLPDVGLRQSFAEGIERYYVRRGPSLADVQAIRALAAAAGMHQALEAAA